MKYQNSELHPRISSSNLVEMTNDKSFWIAIHKLYNVDAQTIWFGKTHKILIPKAEIVDVAYLQI